MPPTGNNSALRTAEITTAQRNVFDAPNPLERNPNQFGDLWIPDSRHPSPFPLVVFFHGGWWKSEYNLDYAGFLCSSLKKDGIASWSVEYRRVGDVGGGWPGTFRDAAAGFDFVTTLARSYPLNVSRMITMGHSAGGHLAFWIAGLHHLSPNSHLRSMRPRVPLLGTIALAGAVDLRLIIDLSGDGVFVHDKEDVYALMGGTPRQRPDRYEEGNPGDLLPFQIPQHLLQGTADNQIPPALPLE